MSDTVQNGSERTQHAFPKGHEKWGGRARGTTNKSVALRRERLAEAERVANEAIGDFEGDTHEFFQYIYRSAAMPLTARIEAAKIIHATERAKLAAIAVVDDTQKLNVFIRDLRAEALAGPVIDVVCEVISDDTETETKD